MIKALISLFKRLLLLDMYCKVFLFTNYILMCYLLSFSCNMIFGIFSANILFHKSYTQSNFHKTVKRQKKKKSQITSFKVTRLVLIRDIFLRLFLKLIAFLIYPGV